MPVEEFWYKEKGEFLCPVCQKNFQSFADVFRPTKIITKNFGDIEEVVEFKLRISIQCPDCFHIWSVFKNWIEKKYPLFSKEPSFLKKRIEVLKNIGDTSMIIKAIQDFIDVSPENTELLYELAFFQYRFGQYKESLSSLSNILKIEPKNFLALELKSKILTRFILAQDPLYADYYFLHDICAIIFDSYKNMQSQLFQVYKLLMEIYASNKTKLPEIFLNASILMEDMYYFKYGIDYCSYALRELTDVKQRAKALLITGRILEKQGNFHKAMDFYEKSYSLVQSERIFIYKGRTLKKLEQKQIAEAFFKNAIEKYSTFIEQNPLNYENYILLGYTYQLLDDIENAIKTYKALQEVPKMDVGIRNIALKEIRKLKEVTNPIVRNLKCLNCLKETVVTTYYYPEQVAGIEEEPGRFSSIVYYRQDWKNICSQCKLEWTEIYFSQEIESEYP